jgi:hypothetical protein
MKLALVIFMRKICKRFPKFIQAATCRGKSELNYLLYGGKSVLEFLQQ